MTGKPEGLKKRLSPGCGTRGSIRFGETLGCGSRGHSQKIGLSDEPRAVALRPSHDFGAIVAGLSSHPTASGV